MNSVLKNCSFAVQSTLIFITVITIGAELIEPLKLSLARLSGHHWVSKGILSLIFFVISLVCAKSKKSSVIEGTQVSLTAVICSIVILLFFVIHYL